VRGARGNARPYRDSCRRAKEIKDFIDSAGEGLRADREKVLLCVAYDTMARRSELVGFDVEDLELLPKWGGADVDSAVKDGPGGGRERGLPLADDGEVAAAVAGECGDQGRRGVLTLGWKGARGRAAA
jgi:hypothetical protein